MNDLIAVTAGWGVIALGVAGLYLFGRDPKANEHDLADYFEQAPERSWAAVDSRRRMLRVEPVAQPVGGPVERVDILPPAPAGMNAGSPLYAGMLFDTWHPEAPAEVAARFLREVGEDARAKAGIRPAYAEHWANADGSCWSDCPECARAMTGAFPVVRAAA